MKERKNAGLRKPEILGCFYETILEEGIEGASIGKIAKRMGIHPSLIMHYFSTKEKLMIELVVFIIGEYSKLLGGIRITHDEPHARLEQLLEILLSEQWYGMTSIAADFAIISVSFRSVDITGKLKHLYALFRKYLASELKRFSEAGIIMVKDPAMTAGIIISMLEGYRHFKHFYVSESDSDGFRNRMKQAVLDILHYDQTGYEPAPRRRRGGKNTGT